MKNNLFLFALIITGLAFAIGCTQNQRAKSFGGTATENLPAGQKLVNATWKEDHLWYLTRPMHTNDVAENYTFKESSSWGILQGTVILKETK